MNRLAVQALRATVVMTGLKATEDEILKGIGFYNDGRQEAIEREMLKAHKSDDWKAKGHALSREMGDCLKSAYRTPEGGSLNGWFWRVESSGNRDGTRLTVSNQGHGILIINRRGRVNGKWDDLPTWKFQILAKSLMAKFQCKIERQRKYSLRSSPAHQ